MMKICIKYIVTSLVIVVFTQRVFCQVPIQLAPVLDIPPALSGSFGELRAGNFHSGIDFRTQGVTGKNIYSMEDGFVSRINIQTGGYGQALYIDHPGGLTSVYGHLDGFNETIDRFVKGEQYRRQSHKIEIFPERERFPVKKGELIAFSGNTGSSGGPHLHFEIRETNGQIPLNVLLINDFGITDKIPPVLYNLAVYPLDSMSQVNSGHSPVYLPLERTANGTFRIQGNRSVKISGKAGFGLETFDFVNENSLRCGVYSIELIMQDKTIYHFQADKFSFPETRYVFAHMDYAKLQTDNKRINLLYRKPNNKLSMYKKLVNDGMINIESGDKYETQIIVKDVTGNKSTLTFITEGTEFNLSAKRQPTEYNAAFTWKRANQFSGSYSDIIIPQGVLYDDLYFNYSINEFTNGIFPYVHNVHNRLTPLHRPATLKIMGAIIPENLRDKAVIVQVNVNGQKTSSGGKWEGDWLVTNISAFGRYTIDVDTIAPTIRPINISPGKDMRNTRSIRFTVDDNLTGISDYKGFINNTWVLFEYDPKEKHLFYTFDSSRLQSGKNHELEVYLTDAVGNKTVYHTSFLW